MGDHVSAGAGCGGGAVIPGSLERASERVRRSPTAPVAPVVSDDPGARRLVLSCCATILQGPALGEPGVSVLGGRDTATASI